MSLAEAIATLRALGIRSIELEPAGLPVQPTASEPAALELSEADLDLMPAAEQKPPGSCITPGCMGRAGFHFAPQFCRECGLAEFGVSVGGVA